MKTTTINAYGKFVSFLMFASGNTRNHYKRGDWNTCELWRHFAWCVITLVVKTILGTVALSAISYEMGYGVLTKLAIFPATFWYHHIVGLVLGLFMVLITLVIGFGATCLAMFINTKWSERTSNRKPNSATKPTLSIVVLYDNWKNKVCSKVEFK